MLRSTLAAVLLLFALPTPVSFADPTPGPTPASRYHDRDLSTLTPDDRAHWATGVWRNEEHDGRSGWWWVLDGVWYYYPEPIYPFPNVVGDDAGTDWFYCPTATPPEYYPWAQHCPGGWQVVGAPSSGDAR